jgi:hypothetical protein
MAASTGFANFPTGLENAIQLEFLNREFEEGLDSILAYRRMALQETVNARMGETLTRTRKGRTPPQIDPLSGVQINANLDNSLSPESYQTEQYTITLNNYAGTQDVPILQELAGVADQVIASARNNGVAAAQTLERLAKIQLFAAYNGGNTFVREGIGTNSLTEVWVDDIRGFRTININGQLVPVSASTPLPCYEYAVGTSGVTQTFSVIGTAASSVNASLFPGSNGAGSTDGISGVLLISGAASVPVPGDAIISSNAPSIMRPGGKMTTAELTGNDVLTLSTVLNAVAYLRNNGVPALSNGDYACILDNVSLRQLFSDQQFIMYYAGNQNSPEIRSGDIIRMMGVTFIPTTEAYVQPATQGIVNTTIRRPIVMGAEALIQGNFEGLEMWLDRPGISGSTVSQVMLVNGVAQILRVPLDRLQQQLSLSWQWVGGFVCPTDITATSVIIPTVSQNITGGNPLYKRCVVLETAG